MNPCTVAADESFRQLVMLGMGFFVTFIVVVILSTIAEDISNSRRIARGEEPCLYI